MSILGHFTTDITISRHAASDVAMLGHVNDTSTILGHFITGMTIFRYATHSMTIGLLGTLDQNTNITTHFRSVTILDHATYRPNVTWISISGLKSSPLVT